MEYKFEYKFDRVVVSNSQQATDHLNKMEAGGWKPIFFFDMGSHNLGVVFERSQVPVGPKVYDPLNDPEPVKRGPGRPKKVAMED
jgi:hypothetical protein